MVPQRYVFSSSTTCCSSFVGWKGRRCKGKRGKGTGARRWDTKESNRARGRKRRESGGGANFWLSCGRQAAFKKKHVTPFLTETYRTSQKIHMFLPLFNHFQYLTRIKVKKRFCLSWAKCQIPAVDIWSAMDSEDATCCGSQWVYCLHHRQRRMFTGIFQCQL